jgi:hypothetical protein
MSLPSPAATTVSVRGLLDPPRERHRLRNHDVALLQMPPDDDLRGALAVLAGELGDDGVAQGGRRGLVGGVEVAERRVGHQHHAVGVQPLAQLVLRPVRVALHLTRPTRDLAGSKACRITKTSVGVPYLVAQRPNARHGQDALHLPTAIPQPSVLIALLMP